MLVVRHFFAILLLCFSFPGLAAPEFPNLGGRVVDNAGMLSPKTEQQITQLLAKHEEKTTNQIVVATLPDLQGYSIEEFANQLFRHWQIGQKETNNGVLLLVGKNDRKLRIEVGYGLEGSLTDALSANIINTVITPQFKKGDFNQGISRGVSAIIKAIKGEYKAKRKGKSRKDTYIPFIFVFFVFWIFAKSYFFPNNQTNGRLRHSGRGDHFGGGFSSGGGGFSGGGGSSGGGGASGGW